MRLLLVTATTGEVAPFIHYLKETASTHQENIFVRDGTSLEWLVTGVGLAATAFAVGRKLALAQYDVALNAGIAGAFIGKDLNIGDVVEVTEDTFADLGALDAYGNFLSLTDLGLLQSDSFPFLNGYLVNHQADASHSLRSVRGVSVNTTSGYAPSIKALQDRCEPEVESMEGAAFFYACLLSGQPFGAVRSISNYIEPRNKENWNIPLAIGNLNHYLKNWWNSRSGK